MLRYWGGPYDGEPVSVRVIEELGAAGLGGVLALPVKPSTTDAGALRVVPLGSCERYRWSDALCRFEWQGTHLTGKVDA